MKILYYLINFAILAGIVLLFGRKIIVSLFRSRRENIAKALDEAERGPEVPEELPEEPLPPIDRSAVESARAASEQQINKVLRFQELECQELQRSKLDHVRRCALEEFEAQVRARFAADNTAEKENERNARLIERILQEITLTPGDMSYLHTHDVLYVTLTSAASLPQELVQQVDEATTELLSQVNGKTSLWVLEEPGLIAGLRLRIGDTVYDGTVENEIYHFKKRIETNPIIGDETVDSIMEQFHESIAGSYESIHVYQRGRVISVSDGICWMDGLADIMYGEVVEFECGERGMVLDIQHNRIGCVIFGQYEHIESGSPVRRVGRIASVKVGNEILGRVVDAIGNPIDQKGHMNCTDARPIEFPAPAILDRAPVKSPLHTGLKAIDSMVPIGKGQRELLIGDRQTGKTAIVLDTILNQKGKDVICIYVGIGQKETSIADFREKLTRYGAMDYTVIVAATASESAAMQYIAPFAGTAIGEYFMYAGKDVLIIYDDLSKHAVAYRELSLLLQRPSGREAYPGDIFYLHSRLLERSAHLSDELGGGSLTALPIVETQAGDISSYIPTNVISITDGQIFLESGLFHEGQRPAVNVGLSVSRVGGSAQTKLMKQVSASLRTKLAQYRELAEFTQFGTEVDDATRQTLDEGMRLTEILKQNRFEPLADWKQALLLYAVTTGMAADIALSEMAAFENGLYESFEQDHPDLVDVLKTGAKLTDEYAQQIRTAVASVAERY